MFEMGFKEAFLKWVLNRPLFKKLKKLYIYSIYLYIYII